MANASSCSLHLATNSTPSSLKTITSKVSGLGILKGEEVPDLAMVRNREGSSTFIKGEPVVNRPDRDPLDAVGACPRHEFWWDNGQVLGEVTGRQPLQLGCKDDLA